MAELELASESGKVACWQPCVYVLRVLFVMQAENSGNLERHKPPLLHNPTDSISSEKPNAVNIT